MLFCIRDHLRMEIHNLVRVNNRTRHKRVKQTKIIRANLLLQIARFGTRRREFRRRRGVFFLDISLDLLACHMQCKCFRL